MHIYTEQENKALDDPYFSNPLFTCFMQKFEQSYFGHMHIACRTVKRLCRVFLLYKLLMTAKTSQWGEDKVTPRTKRNPVHKFFHFPYATFKLGCSHRTLWDKMRYHSFLRSPKKEEQQVPDSANSSEDFSDSATKDGYVNGEVHIMDDLERIWGIENEDDDDEKLQKNDHMFAGQEVNWDFMDWDEFPNGEEGDGEVENEVFCHSERCFFEEESFCKKVVKKESGTVGFWDEDEDMKKVQLNLNLNYQEVLDAWSDRGSLWAEDCSSYSSMAASNGNYMGEVPVMEEEKSTRRRASVQRYKEKRQSRLFSKKIRYQVRKLNADKRPRLKGRFVKRVL